MYFVATSRIGFPCHFNFSAILVDLICLKILATSEDNSFKKILMYIMFFIFFLINIFVLTDEQKHDSFTYRLIKTNG